MFVKKFYLTSLTLALALVINVWAADESEQSGSVFESVLIDPTRYDYVCKDANGMPYCAPLKGNEVDGSIELLEPHRIANPEPHQSNVVPYVLQEPTDKGIDGKYSLLIYLYGRGGSIESYNLQGKPYDELREILSARGYFTLVPELGPNHWMNDTAMQELDELVAKILADHPIDKERIHIMGSSMGGGSALAYAIHRPDIIRSVCSHVGMTDFRQWYQESPAYRGGLENAYGGTPASKPDAYRKVSAMANIDSFSQKPVFLVYGQKDPLVNPQHGRQFAEALKAKGCYAVYREAKDKGHSDEVVRDFCQEIADFFDMAAGIPSEGKANVSPTKTRGKLQVQEGSVRDGLSYPGSFWDEQADAYEGRYFSGQGDAEYLQLLDTARRMFGPDAELQNLSMLYTPAWNGLVEGPQWGMWWVQNSYGPTYCSLPFLAEPFRTFLQNAQACWFNYMGDGKRHFTWAGKDHGPVPDGALCDCANDRSVISKQGDGRVDIHDWGMEFTAAGALMQAELLLIDRDQKTIEEYLPKLERCASFIESRRDAQTDLFLAGPAGNLLAPSYAGWRRPDGSYTNW